MHQDDVKRRLRQGRFLAKILNFEIDEQEYTVLCNDLRWIANAWSGATCIDKEMAWLIFELPKILLNCAHDAEHVGAEMSDRIWEMAQDIDTLVLDCFSDASFR